MTVPTLPGLPTLFSTANFVSVFGLLTGDIVNPSEFSFTPQWGVYLNGAPVLAFDTFVSIDYRQGWAVADYPVERGAFESYDKVSLPFDARVKFASGGSEENRQALLDSVKAAAKTLLRYDVVTPEAIYTSVNIQHYDYRRTSTNGVGMITVEIWFLEIRIAGASGDTGSADATNGTATSDASAKPFVNSAADLTNTVDPSGMSSFYDGVIQAKPPTDAQTQAFASLPPVQ